MLEVPFMSPMIVEIAPGIGLHWYGAMYVCGFYYAYRQGRRRLDEIGLDNERFLDLLGYVALGIICGGRIGYVGLYQSAEIHNWLQLWAVHRGGMSFHGALLGGILATAYFAYQQRLSLCRLGDFIVPLLPIGLACGRIGNFINGELWGRPCQWPWGVIFTAAYDGIPRHPSPLYECCGEGLLLYWILSRCPTPPPYPGYTALRFLWHYAWIRAVVECWREPDAQIGYLVGNMLTMGQLLSLVMAVSAGILWWVCRQRPHALTT